MIGEKLCIRTDYSDPFRKGAVEVVFTNSPITFLWGFAKIGDLGLTLLVASS